MPVEPASLALLAVRWATVRFPRQELHRPSGQLAQPTAGFPPVRAPAGVAAQLVADAVDGRALDDRDWNDGEAGRTDRRLLAAARQFVAYFPGRETCWVKLP